MPGGGVRAVATLTSGLGLAVAGVLVPTTGCSDSTDWAAVASEACAKVPAPESYQLSPAVQIVGSRQVRSPPDP